MKKTPGDLICPTIIFIILVLMIAVWSPTAQAAGSGLDVTATGSGIMVSGTAAPFTPVSIVVNQNGSRCYLNQTATDGTGAFSLAIPIPNGSYQVQAALPGQTLPAVAVQVTSSGTGGTGGPVVTNQARISITGYAGVILPATDVSFSGSITVMELLQQVAASHGLSLEITNGYVSGINGQREFDKGPTSGWKYSINGTVPGVGASGARVRNGDVIEWFYINADSQVPLLYQLPDGLMISWPEVMKRIDLLLEYSREDVNLTDWGVLGLVFHGDHNAALSYRDTLQAELKEVQGKRSRVTDIERQAILAGAAGLNPQAISGNNLLAQIYNHDNLTRQGTNGIAFGLIALDYNKAVIPDDALWSRERMINWLLEQQQAGGAWGLANDQPGDVDITAMTLTALAPYQNQPTVKRAVDKALAWLSQVQLPNGGFENSGLANSESSSQVIIALCSLGISPEDERFIKPKGTLIGCWLQYQQTGGGFAHEYNQPADTAATEQALLAAAALKNFWEKKPPIYQSPITASISDVPVLADYHLVSSWARTEVQKAVQLGIIRGISDNPLLIAPRRAITRAELAVMLERMNLPAPGHHDAKSFADVSPSQWYYNAVSLAAARGWVSGMPGGRFGPSEPVSRQEMAAIIVRACPDLPLLISGIDFHDMDAADPGSRRAIIQAASAGIINGANGNFEPQGKVTREMAAAILVRLQAVTDSMADKE